MMALRWSEAVGTEVGRGDKNSQRITKEGAAKVKAWCSLQTPVQEQLQFLRKVDCLKR